MNVGGTRNALELAAQARRRATSTRSPRSRPPATTAASSTSRCSTRASACPRRTTARSSSPRRSSARSATVPWRVYRPAIVVGHSETGAMDKVDGPYYFFPVLKRLRDIAARLGAAGRRRPRRHQRGAGRLRRQGDGPHRPPARPRRPGLPPGQPRAAEHRRAGQHLRRGRQGAPVRRARRPQRHRPGADGHAPPRPAPDDPARASRCGRRRCTSRSSRPSVGSASRPRCSSTSRSPRSTPRVAPRRRSPGSGISVPDLESYASTLWSLLGGDARRLDQGRLLHRQGADRQDRRDHRRLLGHRPGDGGAGRQGRRHPDPGRAGHRQARGHQGG